MIRRGLVVSAAVLALAVPAQARVPRSAIRADGRVSWFDDSNVVTGDLWTPGVAVARSDTMGGFWWVRFENRAHPLLRQIDFGPDPGTGRTLDVHRSGLHAAGYTAGGFPTDSWAQAVYVGHGRAHAHRVAVRWGLVRPDHGWPRKKRKRR